MRVAQRVYVNDDPMNAVIYARVSTTDQSCEMQLLELREYAVRRRWKVAGEYVGTPAGAAPARAGRNSTGSCAKPGYAASM